MTEQIIRVDTFTAWKELAWREPAERLRELPGLADYLDDHLLVELHLNEERHEVTMIERIPDQPDHYRLTTKPAADFIAEFELDPDLAEDYRTITEQGGGAERGPWSCPDIAELTVPARAFVAEVDALFGRPPMPTPPVDTTPAAILAEALAALFGDYPTGPENAPTTPLAITDPDTGVTRTVSLERGQVEWLTRMITAEAATNREAHAGGTGRCGHCGAAPHPHTP
ncbi:hypothetical protein [Planomonospora sp. ID82291]|uniref:hypothetical protein n=1 Tax=Planomonospora sp. ID82291 TaxID=2738136 RepID=UPI0018C369EC|nr:hypothetical protein [Planomonospora sp. ID82291]MBG0819041.1 hypothetical protein [Planomonospora sp. ID82291]